MTIGAGLTFVCRLVAPLSAATAENDQTGHANPTDRLRLIVETDAGGDPDDEQSLVRFLLYTNEWDVEGIIATRPIARDGENLNVERTGLGIIRRMLNAYQECFPNLKQHDAQYPSPEFLNARTVAGYHDDDGVSLIIHAIDADDPRPVWFLNWGTDLGSAESSLKRALDKIVTERGPEGYAKFKNRLRLSSADKFGDHTATLTPPFPIWVDTFRPELERKRWYHRFSALTATAGGFDIERDCRTGHGPLGALYPLNTTHPQKEGDTGTFLYLVPTGMNDPDQPTWGSWAGRYGRQEQFPDRNYFWANQADAWNGTTHRDNTLRRWAADLQNDFKARLDWCVKPPAEANHPPIVAVAGDRQRSLKAGDIVSLDATATRDPDGDALAYRWRHYREPGTFPRELRIDQADKPTLAIVAPDVDSTETVHVLLTVTDNGSPPLSRYTRIVMTVEPAAR
jgi:hypothetical protein